MLTNLLEYQRHRLFLWVPVLFACGIGVYFQLTGEPTLWMIVAISIVGLGSLLAIRPDNLVRSVIFASIGLSSLGYSYAAYRTQNVAAPVMAFRYYGPIEGTIIGLDRSANNAVRIMLNDVYLPGIAPAKTPKHIRVSLQGFIPEGTITAGARVALTGSLSPPGPPVEPGGFDFRRMAWFMQLGAVGYTRNPVIPAAGGNTQGFDHWIFQLRMQISAHIQSRIEGQNGAFAAAILTGDRSGIDPEILKDLRAANLAHLLAISGLHMGLLSGFVFGILRYGLALVPRVALQFQPKKLAAGIALVVGFGYLLLSGANVATQRAFIMTAVVLMAVILDRPAFTLRAVALAAMIVLLIKPYSLLEAGFQMSFAATTALISVFEWLRGRAFWTALNYGRWRWLKPLIGLTITSAVAGMATAPFSAFHFNQISQYGLAANLLAVPMMGLIAMPSAVIAGILSPFDLDGLPFALMGEGIGFILRVASFFANLDGATIALKSGPSLVLVLIGGGGIILTLWRGRGKLVGVAIMILAAVIWISTPRPTILVTEDAKLFGMLGTSGRITSKPRGSSYAVRIWLENDGDVVKQAEAFARVGMEHSDDLVSYTLANGWTAALYSGKDELRADNLCRANTILIVPKFDAPTGECLGIDADHLKPLGALAINFEGNIPIIIGSREAAENRLWGQN